jgi:hypothetical protein
MFDNDRPLPEGLKLFRAIVIFLIAAICAVLFAVATFKLPPPEVRGSSQWNMHVPDRGNAGKGGEVSQ